MLEKSSHWIANHWWGLIVAYMTIVAGLFSVIWLVLESMGIPTEVEIAPGFVQSRFVLHLLTAVLLAPYFTLVLDIFVRKTTRNSSRVTIGASDNLLGKWAGKYQYNRKWRKVALELQSVDHNLTATIRTETDEGHVIQHASLEDFDNTFRLVTKDPDRDILRSQSSRTGWRPEVWVCSFSESGKLRVVISDQSKSGVVREIATTELLRQDSTIVANSPADL